MTEHTNRKEIVRKLRSDNTNAQRVRCGGCFIMAVQFPGGITEKNVVDLADRRDSGESTNNPGLLCDVCLKNPGRVKEGPAMGVEIGPDGQVKERVKDSIPVSPRAAKELAAEAVKLAKETGSTVPAVATATGTVSATEEGGASTKGNTRTAVGRPKGK